MSGTVCRSYFDCCTRGSANSYMAHARDWMNRASETFRGGYHLTSLVREIIKLVGGSSQTLDKLSAVAEACDTARSVNDSVRLIFPVYNLATGQMFVKKDKESGELFVKDWSDIAMGVMELGARLLGPVRLGHQLKIYDLGVHAPRLSGASMGLWGALLGIDWLKSIYNLTDIKTETLRKRVLDSVQSTIDTVALPFDFGAGANHSALAITGGVLNVTSVLFKVVRDVVEYHIEA
jgi:hypothetical protein